MNEVYFIKTSGGLVPSTEADKEIFNKWKLGRVICGKFKQIRSYDFHKRYFGLLNLAFEYYEPSSGVLTSDEKRIATKIFKELDFHSEGTGTLLEYGREFLRRESEERKKNIENIQQAFEPFRNDMTIEAGFYDYVQVPTGIKKVAKSVSFSSMDEMEFRELYKSMFNTLWRFVLSRHFTTEQDAENAAVRMLNFA
jgi:hypothetical protein